MVPVWRLFDPAISIWREDRNNARFTIRKSNFDLAQHYSAVVWPDVRYLHDIVTILLNALVTQVKDETEWSLIVYRHTFCKEFCQHCLLPPFRDH